LLSRDTAYTVRRAATIALITRTIHGIPVEVALDRSDGMPTRCVINLDTINTIPLALLEKRICTLSDAKMALVEDAIHFALGLQT
jgi:mRNA interferase MazF